MDPYYIFDNSLRIEKEAVTDGRLLKAIRSAVEESSGEDLSEMPEVINTWHEAVGLLKKYIYLELSEKETGNDRYLDIEFIDTEVYPDETIETFFRNIASFATGGISFDTSLVYSHYRYELVDSTLKIVALSPCSNIYAVIDKSTGRFAGTVGEAFIDTLDKTRYKTVLANDGCFVPA